MAINILLSAVLLQNNITWDDKFPEMFGPFTAIKSVAILSNSGKHILLTSPYGWSSIHVFEWPSQSHVASFERVEKRDVYTISDTSFFAVSSGNEIECYSLKTRQLTWRGGYRSPISDLRVDESGRLIATIKNGDRKAEVFDSADGAYLESIVLPPSPPGPRLDSRYSDFIRSLGIGLSGNPTWLNESAQIAFWGGPRNVMVNLKAIDYFSVRPVEKKLVLPNGNYITGDSPVLNLHIVPLNEGEEEQVIELVGHTAMPSIRPYLLESRVVTYCQKFIRVWDASTGKELHSLDLTSKGIRYYSDGSSDIGLGTDKEILRLGNLRNGYFWNLRANELVPYSSDTKDISPWSPSAGPIKFSAENYDKIGNFGIGYQLVIDATSGEVLGSLPKPFDEYLSTTFSLGPNSVVSWNGFGNYMQDGKLVSTYTRPGRESYKDSVEYVLDMRKWYADWRKARLERQGD